MAKVNLYEFKSHFSDYARRVKGGETVILCERNIPIAEIRPIVRTALERRPAPGRFRGQISVEDAFFDADAELARDFSSADD